MYFFSHNAILIDSAVHWWNLGSAGSGPGNVGFDEALEVVHCQFLFYTVEPILQVFDLGGKNGDLM